MTELIEQLSHTQTRAKEIEKIMKYVPCVMHCENCMSLKIITMLLEKDLLYAQGDVAGVWLQKSQLRNGGRSTTIKQIEDEYIKAVDEEICKNI